MTFLKIEGDAMHGEFAAHGSHTAPRKRCSPWRSFNSAKQCSTIVSRRRYLARPDALAAAPPTLGSLRRRIILRRSRDANRYIDRASGSLPLWPCVLAMISPLRPSLPTCRWRG